MFDGILEVDNNSYPDWCTITIIYCYYEMDSLFVGIAQQKPFHWRYCNLFTIWVGLIPPLQRISSPPMSYCLAPFHEPSRFVAVIVPHWLIRVKRHLFHHWSSFRIPNQDGEVEQSMENTKTSIWIPRLAQISEKFSHFWMETTATRIIPVKSLGKDETEGSTSFLVQPPLAGRCKRTSCQQGEAP